MTKAKMKLKKGDQVMVLSGRDKGAKGEILKVMPATRRAVVQGINMITKHVKPSQANPQGGLEKREASIDVSNLGLVDPKDGKPTRVGYTTLKDGKKVRVARRSGETIE